MKSLRRTILFVPANNPRMIEKASGLGADMIILDLEDSVPQNEKPKAREVLHEGIKSHDWGNKEVGVRVNGSETPHFLDDLRIAVSSGAHFIVLPKIEDALGVKFVEQLITYTARWEAMPNKKQPPKIIVTIENPRGLNNVEDILTSSSSITAVEFGAEDYALSLDISGLARSELSTLYARSRVVAAARACAIDPLDQAFVGLNDPDGLRTSAIEAKNLGFTGKAVIHPNQIEIVNRVFSPSQDDVNWAHRILDAWKTAEKEGRGAFRLDDKMVDVVHVKMAESIIKKAEQLGLTAS